MKTSWPLPIGIDWLRGCLPHRVQPRLEVVVWLGDDLERHVRVLQAAEFGALPAKDPGPVGAQPDGGDVAGNQIAFALEVRRPKR